MGKFKFRTALIGLSSVLAASYSLFAQTTVDATFDDNQNDMDYYWYYYDDNTGVGKYDRPQKAPSSKPSEILVPAKDSVRHAFGQASDTKVIKKYQFVTDKSGDQRFATLPFKFGDEWDCDTYTAEPFVGIGTMLIYSGGKIDITGATSITFNARSRVNSSVVLNFKLQTKDLDDYSEVAVPPAGAFGYFAKPVTISNSWNTYTVKISDLKRPSWSTSAKPDPKTIDIKQATKIAWEVPKELNTSVDADTIDIKDVTIDGTYKYVSPALWTQTASLDPLPSSGQFATFDHSPKNQSPLGTYWYAYNDAEIGGNSSADPVTAVQDTATKRLKFNFVDASGQGGGFGAKLGYTLGAAIPKGSISVAGFMGIGCNVYDSTGVAYFNAKGAGANSIYFQYITSGDAKKVTLEISDINDVGDYDHPDRKDTRGDGIVYYRDLPATDDEAWHAVEIPFDSLVWHEHWDGVHLIPFDPTHLAKIQWKVQGSEGVSGFFAIDNVYFPGVPADKFELTPVAVRYGQISKKVAPFQVSLLNDRINVKSNVTGKVSLVNIKGAVVKTAAIANTGSISAKDLPSGMYLVKLNGVNNGKAVTMQSSINIVK